MAKEFTIKETFNEKDLQQWERTINEMKKTYDELVEDGLYSIEEVMLHIKYKMRQEEKEKNKEKISKSDEVLNNLMVDPKSVFNHDTIIMIYNKIINTIMFSSANIIYMDPHVLKTYNDAIVKVLCLEDMVKLEEDKVYINKMNMLFRILNFEFVIKEIDDCFYITMASSVNQLFRLLETFAYTGYLVPLDPDYPKQDVDSWVVPKTLHGLLYTLLSGVIRQTDLERKNEKDNENITRAEMKKYISESFQKVIDMSIDDLNILLLKIGIPISVDTCYNVNREFCLRFTSLMNLNRFSKFLDYRLSFFMNYHKEGWVFRINNNEWFELVTLLLAYMSINNNNDMAAYYDFIMEDKDIKTFTVTNRCLHGNGITDDLYIYRFGNKYSLQIENHDKFKTIKELHDTPEKWINVVKDPNSEGWVINPAIIENDYIYSKLNDINTILDSNAFDHNCLLKIDYNKISEIIKDLLNKLFMNKEIHIDDIPQVNMFLHQFQIPAVIRMTYSTNEYMASYHQATIFLFNLINAISYNATKIEYAETADIVLAKNDLRRYLFNLMALVIKYSRFDSVRNLVELDHILDEEENVKYIEFILNSDMKEINETFRLIGIPFKAIDSNDGTFTFRPAQDVSEFRKLFARYLNNTIHVFSDLDDSVISDEEDSYHVVLSLILATTANSKLTCDLYEVYDAIVNGCDPNYLVELNKVLHAAGIEENLNILVYKYEEDDLVYTSIDIVSKDIFIKYIDALNTPVPKANMEISELKNVQVGILSDNSADVEVINPSMKEEIENKTDIIAFLVESKHNSDKNNGMNQSEWKDFCMAFTKEFNKIDRTCQLWTDRELDTSTINECLRSLYIPYRIKQSPYDDINIDTKWKVVKI